MSRIKLSDIARAAGVSISTVSMALGDYPDVSAQTRMRVRQLCQQMNYQPRRKGVRRRRAEKRALRLGLFMVGYEQKLSTEGAPLRHVLTQGAAMDCRFEVSVIAEADDATQVEQLQRLSRDLDGVLLDGFVRPTLLKRTTAALSLPVVLMGNTYGDPLGPVSVGCQVTTDMRSMGHLAARALLKAGHRRIAFICTKLFENLYYEQWLAGFRHAHADANVPLDPSLLLITGNVPNKHTLAARAMMSKTPPPTAAVIPDPGTAATVLESLRASGHEMPREAVVIGGDRAEAVRQHVEHFPLITPDMEMLARAALELLIAAQGQPLRDQKVLIPFEAFNMPSASSSS